MLTRDDRFLVIDLISLTLVKLLDVSLDLVAVRIRTSPLGCVQVKVSSLLLKCDLEWTSI